MEIEAVIFDLYGTLIDIETDEWDLNAYITLSHSLEYYNIFYRPEELLTQYHEKVNNLFQSQTGKYADIDVYNVFEEVILEGLGTKPEPQMVINVARLFRSLTTRRLCLFKDTLPALEVLKKTYLLGIVSNTQWVFSEPEIKTLKIDRFFDTVIFSSRFSVRKPDSRLFYHALEALRILPDKVLYVGDDPNEDIHGATEIGIPVVIVNRSYQYCNGPIITSLRDIPHAIQGIQKYCQYNSSTNMKKILMADDEMSIRLLYSEELKERGYEVYLAANGREALEIVDLVPLDLVILDIKMSEMDGIEALRQIKERHPDLPVILSTAYGEYRQDFATWASDEYLVKSSGLEELLIAINKHLGEKCFY